MTFPEILEGYEKPIQEIAWKLRSLILPLHPDIGEDLNRTRTMSSAFYRIGSSYNVIMVIQPAKDHCKLYLHYTDRVDTRDLPLQGKGKHAKHIKLFEWDPSVEEDYRQVLKDITAIVATKV